MVYGINKGSNCVDYVFSILLLAFTSFEFFFREESLFFVLTGLAIICSLNKKYYIYPSILVCFVVFILCYIFQYIYIENYEITSVISRTIHLLGCICIAQLIYKHFIDTYINIIYWLSLISIIIYLSCTITPGIKDFLINNIAPYFISLNAETAIQEGGGINVLVYNFQVNSTLDSVGLMRNCGPFWEPGMYAVFLDIALFFNLFIKQSAHKFFNVIILLSIITTFSTGGYVTTALIFLFYVFTRHNVLLKIIGLIIFITVLIFTINLDFIGDKIATQFNSAEVGNDVSRFSAILTQFEMIKDYPLTGGAQLADYTDTKTLASGLFYTFIQYGIPVGLFFYIMFYKAIRQLFINYSNALRNSILFFILLLGLSISQTIFANDFFITFLFIGLLHKKYEIL